MLIDGDISELDLTASHVHELQHQVSEEVTVAHRGPKLTWVTGLFFFGEVDRQPSSIFARGPRLENRLDPRVEASASAGFGQATVALTSRVAVTAGLRYTHERKTIDNRIELYTIDAPITLPVQFVVRVYRCDLARRLVAEARRRVPRTPDLF